MGFELLRLLQRHQDDGWLRQRAGWFLHHYFQRTLRITNAG